MSNILMFFFIHIQYTQCGKIITIISNVSKGQDLMNKIKNNNDDDDEVKKYPQRAIKVLSSCCFCTMKELLMKLN